MNIVVIGAGLAGANAVEELRIQGYTGDITLIGAEPHPPYERPPLSKGLLLGTVDPTRCSSTAASGTPTSRSSSSPASRVTDIDLDTGHVDVGGRQWSYDRLLLATGATPAAPPARRPVRSRRRLPAHPRRRARPAAPDSASIC